MTEVEKKIREKVNKYCDKETGAIHFVDQGDLIKDLLSLIQEERQGAVDEYRIKFESGMKKFAKGAMKELTPTPKPEDKDKEQDDC